MFREIGLAVLIFPHSLTHSLTHSLLQITAYVKGLPASHPNKVKMEKAGNSVDNRPIYILTITDNVDRAKTLKKPVVFIDGGKTGRKGEEGIVGVELFVIYTHTRSPYV